MGSIRVCVLDEHEIFRRGVVACLREDPALAIETDSHLDTLDLAVVSPSMARSRRFPCPLLICAADSAMPSGPIPNRVLGVLSRTLLTPERLLGAVHAAAAGLQISVSGAVTSGSLGTRGLAVLRLLAAGHDTDEIARELGCSDRTIKLDIAGLRRSLGARNRAQAVAEGIRHGVI